MVIVRFPDLESRELNDVGGRIWDLADGRASEDIASVVAREFDVPIELARDDVAGFVAELAADGWLQVEVDP